MRSKRIWLVLLAVVALVAAACTSVDEATPTTDGAADTAPAATDDGGADTTEPATTEGENEEDGDVDAVAQRDYRFVVVTHGQSSDPFWSVAANGVAAAGEDMGVTVEYQAPGTFDMVEMGQIIEAAVASQPDGLVVSIPAPEALADPIRAAVAALIFTVGVWAISQVASWPSSIRATPTWATPAASPS